jgi:hypothetical protein
LSNIRDQFGVVVKASEVFEAWGVEGASDREDKAEVGLAAGR